MINRGQGNLALTDAALHWQAACSDQPIACVVLLHDLGEHAGCYSQFSDSLADNDIAVYSFDLRGHGQSTGIRGHVDGWSQFISDLKQVVEFVKTTEGAVPLYLYGHGLGGLIALDYAASFAATVQGLVINGVAMQPLAQASTWLGHLSKFVGKLWPEHQLNLGRYQPGLQAWEASATDPLLHKFASVQLITEMTRAIARVRVTSLDIALPVLITHGEQDQVNSTLGSRELHALLASKDKSIEVYANVGHTIAHCLQLENYLFDVANWILPRASTIAFERERHYKIGSPDQAPMAEKRSVSSLAN